LFGCDYDDAFFRQIADAFVSTGLRDAGYEYMVGAPYTNANATPMPQTPPNP